jgi:methanogenic corrinoid protein MtbC1
MAIEPPAGGNASERIGVYHPTIANLTYQSLAAEAQTPSELAALLAQAKVRNRSVGVTGMLLFNEGRFFQWLEGPPEGISELWASIQTDTRHRQIELLSQDQVQYRMFSEWDMRFVSQDTAFKEISDQRIARRALPATLIDAAAKLAIDQKVEALLDGFEDVVNMGYDVASVYAELVEPVAHRLGDWWLEELCNSAEIAIALCSLQMAARQLAQRHLPVAPTSKPRQVLVAPQPAEPHMLGLTLVSDLYHQAGWFVDVAFPCSDEEIEALVHDKWFDVLTLTVSDVFPRYDAMDALAGTISKARGSSLNAGLVIVVGGRTFKEKPELGAIVGADSNYLNLAEAIEKVEACLKDKNLNYTLN